MRTLFSLIVFVTLRTANNIDSTCKPVSIPASTPVSQLYDNGDQTITDVKTGLIWKKCMKGLCG
jgi:hypothetical protein